MANEVRIKFPKLFPEQARIAGSSAPLNVVAGGLEAGKTTLAIDILLTHRLGALRGYPVAFLLPDEEAVDVAKRRLYALIERLITSRLDRDRVDIGRGSITFYRMDQKFDLWGQFSLVVIDDAHRMERLLPTWDNAIEPLLRRYRGQAWIFGRPRGLLNDFASLADMADRDGGMFRLPATANPHLDQGAVARDRDRMSPDAFLQEREGLFVDSGIELTESQSIIGHDETFRQWCERLAASGMQVDDMPFQLDNRPAMHFIYDLIPASIEAARGRFVVMMKCTQVGFTVMEMLAMIYMAIKFMPCKIGMYLPDKPLAEIKSSVRFLPIVRTVPDAYRLLTEDVATGKNKGEGNVLVRVMGRSRFHFMWTSGKGATESIPLDVLSLDEVQNMAKGDIEKTRERLSGSRVKFVLAGSTANLPDEDIHWLFKRGTQHQFWTKCPNCGEYHALDSYFPECIKFDPERRDYRYVCKSCHGWIDDPQCGEWRAQAGYWDMEKERWVDEEGAVIPESVHYPQFLSPTITPREIITKYWDADDLKNFWNRVLGKPYTDPSQVPVNLEMLQECAKLGMELGVQWETRGYGYYMGIDQMGLYNVAIISKRLPSGHMAIVHVEEILVTPTPENPDVSPFDRCDELMVQFGIACCVVESLPNYNDAKRFAARWPGKVFLANYADMKEDMLRWGDTPRLNATDRRTDEGDRDDHTVQLDQYKCMQVAMKRIQNRVTVFADPEGLKQEVYEKGTKGELVIMPLLRDRVFFHFTRTALIAEKDEEQRKYRRKVVKVGIDPHFSYAYMLMNVAWARAHGTTMFLFADESSQETNEMSNAKVTSQILDQIKEQRAAVADLGTCGACISYLEGKCQERDLRVRPEDTGCAIFLPREDLP